MIIKKRKNRSPKKDAQKEQTFRKFKECLESHGLVIRREKLKSGPCWRVLSGVCRMRDQKMVFVDNSLDQDAQIEFLVDQIKANKISVSDELRQEYPIFFAT